MTPYPRRMGGRGQFAGPVLERIVNSLSAQMGAAFDTTSSSNVFPWIMAMARELAGVWSANARLANQWDPQRMTDFIVRWERIFGLTPSPTDTDTTRRKRIALAFARLTLFPTYQQVSDFMRSALGPVFVTIVHTSTATNAPTVIGGVMQSPVGPATVFTPTGWPVGTVDPTGQSDWLSNVAHLMVQVTQPTGMTDADFYATTALIGPLLDPVLPAWVTWDWFRVVHASGTAAGFYLDGDATSSGTLVNLDNEAFST